MLTTGILQLANYVWRIFFIAANQLKYRLHKNTCDKHYHPKGWLLPRVFWMNYIVWDGFLIEWDTPHVPVCVKVSLSLPSWGFMMGMFPNEFILSYCSSMKRGSAVTGLLNAAEVWSPASASCVLLGTFAHTPWKPNYKCEAWHCTTVWCLGKWWERERLSGSERERMAVTKRGRDANWWNAGIWTQERTLLHESAVCCILNPCTSVPDETLPWHNDCKEMGAWWRWKCYWWYFSWLINPLSLFWNEYVFVGHLMWRLPNVMGIFILFRCPTGSDWTAVVLTILLRTELS